MAAAPAVGSDDDGADGKARNVVVKSESVDMEECLPRDSVTDPIDDDLQSDEDGHGDSTECSSSFGGSCFASDDDAESDAGVMEVDSSFFSHINVDDITAEPHYVRKKKVASDWSKFIGQERWRCQWLELRMKDLLSQVEKYDKELALINHEKDLQLEMIEADSRRSELSLDLLSQERNTMRRRKRKKHEDITDTSLYIKNHQILSYYTQENKRSRAENEKCGTEKTETDELLVSDGFNSLDIEDIKYLGSNDRWLESKENDTVVQQCYMRETLLEIERIQSHVINLQSHLSEAHNQGNHCKKTQKTLKKKDSHSSHKMKNVGKPFGPVLSILSDAPDFARECVKRNNLEYGAVDTTQLDENETTVEMLFGVNNSLPDACIRGIYKENADDVLIENQAASKEGFWQFERLTESKEQTTRAQSPEQVYRTALVVKKKQPKIKKKCERVIPSLQEQNQTEMDNLSIEKTRFVSVHTRRSQRVRKPKIYESK